MNSVIDRYRRQRVPSPTECEPKPEPCSTCGRLECLCRPRFFAGQILTADDLNRLDGYIRGKHRLHNRQLHGWGVVNGLEVSCNVCGPGVVVGCGYALSPCGEDIVVCDPVVVDVCALVKACKGAERPQVCDPPRQPTPAGCEQGDEEWILAIRYSESPTRGVKPLLAAGSSGCGCSSPGKSQCSCGGGCASRDCACGNGVAKPKPRIAPVQCEPTVICEGFGFEVYRKPAEPDRSGDDDRLRLNPESELYKRFECCVELLATRIPKMPGALSLPNVQQNLVAWHDWVCSFKEYLQIYLSTRPGYNCELLARLNAVVCPPLSNDNAAVLVFQTAVLLLLVWLDAVLACYCSALLPPCPPAHPVELVPLASFRVTGDPCRVRSICNWTRHRKIATTFPALQYWLSILPFGTELRELIDRLCCLQIAGVFTPRQPDTPGSVGGFQPSPDFASARAAAAHRADGGSGGNGGTGGGGGTGGTGGSGGTGGGTGGGNGNGGEGDGRRGDEFAAAHPLLYERAARRLNPASANPDRLKAATSLASRALARGKAPLDPQKFVESVFLPDKDKGSEHLSALELRNLPQFFAFEQVLRPIATAASSLDALGPAIAAMGLGEWARPGEPGEGDDTTPARSGEVGQLRKEMAALREDLARQAAEIKRLKETGRRRKEK